MTLTENGWTMIDEPGAWFKAPNGWRVNVRNADAAALFEHIAGRWHNEIEPITVIGGWRKGTPIAGTKRMSNHTAGLAIDINPHLHTYEYTRKLQGRPYIETFTDKQLATLHKIKDDLQDLAGARVITLGIDYKPPRRDGMHVEVRCSAETLRKAADAIRDAADEDNTGKGDAWADGVLKIGDRGEPVADLQRFFLAVFPAYPSVKTARRWGADGVFGKDTAAVVEEFQARTGLTADGVVGKDTLATLARYGFKR